MNVQQLAGAIVVIAEIAKLEPRRLLAIVGVELHTEQLIEALADGRAEAIGGSECGGGCAFRQLLEDALGAIAKDGGCARQDALVEIAYTNKAAVAACQMAQHQQCGLVQVLQLIKQHRIKAALQWCKAGVVVQRGQLTGQCISAVAGRIEQRLLGGPFAPMLIAAQQPIQAIVQGHVAAVRQSSDAGVCDATLQHALFGQGLKVEESADIQRAGEVVGQFGHIECGVPLDFLRQRRMCLLDKQVFLQRRGEYGHRVPLLPQHQGTELLQREDVQLFGVYGGDSGQPFLDGLDARL